MISRLLELNKWLERLYYIIIDKILYHFLEMQIYYIYYKRKIKNILFFVYTNNMSYVNNSLD